MNPKGKRKKWVKITGQHIRNTQDKVFGWRLRSYVTKWWIDWDKDILVTLEEP